MKFNGVSNGPYLVVDLWGGTGTPQRVLRMAAYCDSGAEVNVVGKKWISYLELHGAAIENVTPIELQWLDRKVTVQVSQAMKLSVQIAGCNKTCEVKFFVAPWDLEYLVLGWETLSENNILDQLSELRKTQKELGIPVIVNKDNDNMLINSFISLVSILVNIDSP